MSFSVNIFPLFPNFRKRISNLNYLVCISVARHSQLSKIFISKIICLIYTARNAQVADSLLQSCCIAVIKPTPGCVDDHKSAAGLMQVDCQDILSTGLMKVVSTTCNTFANI